MTTPIVAPDEGPLDFDQTSLEIPSRTPGWNLDAWKYLPKPKSKVQVQVKGFPVIIMAHGVSANKLLGLAAYAEVFASLGYGVVVFDYRRWGASDGRPRDVLYVSEQLEDYRTVIKYCRQQPEFDPQRVVLWGTSLSGGHVVTLASEKNLYLAAVLCQCPYLGNAARPPLNWAFVKTIFTAVLDVLRQMVGLGPAYMPAVALPGEVGLLTAPGSTEGMFEIVGDKEGTYPNQIAASALFEFPFYNPTAFAARISCPTRVIVAEHDNQCPMRQAMELKRLSTRVDLVLFPVGHFELYPGKDTHAKVLDAMKSFLLETVPPTVARSA